MEACRRPSGTSKSRTARAYDIGRSPGDKIDLPAGSLLVIQATDGCRPTWRPKLIVRFVSLSTDGSACILDGLLIEGGIDLGGSLDLWIKHCTLVPGGALNENGRPADPDADEFAGSGVRRTRTVPSLTASPARCVCRPNRHLTIQDSIVQALPRKEESHSCGHSPGTARTRRTDGPWRRRYSGPPSSACVRVSELTLAADTIFAGRVEVGKTNQGCVRYSYLSLPPEDGHHTPPGYRCQPELAVGLRPEDEGANRGPRQAGLHFSALGDPGFAQLSLACPAEIRTGAEDGSEMGASRRLKQPQREANLRAVLDEYFPVGLEAGLVYVT